MRCRYFTIQKFEEYFLLFIGVASQLILNWKATHNLFHIF